MIKTLFITGMIALLSGCDDGKPAVPNRGAAPVPAQAQHSVDVSITDQWIGRWIGIEGLNLTISRDQSSGPGNYILRMNYGPDAALSGSFKGQTSADGIVFTREGGQHLLRAGDGEATGLKWLAEKKTCLIVTPGEGYCRS